MKVNTENIRKVHFRVNAESIVNTLLANGVAYEDIIIRFKSGHSKNWGHDVIRSEKKGDKIYLDIARDGLFHSLPEYLFVLPTADGRQQPDLEAFNKQQKIHANILLNPIEHSVFEGKVGLDQFEQDILRQLFTSSLPALTDFYRIDPSIDLISRSKLARMFPFVYSIAGRFPLTAVMLSFLLDLPTDFHVTETQKTIETDTLQSDQGLSDSSIGESMLLGGDFQYVVPVVKFTVGPVKSEDVTKFLPGGEKCNIFDCFSKYFIPLDYDIELLVDVDDSESTFSFENAFLGFNTTTK